MFLSYKSEMFGQGQKSHFISFHQPTGRCLSEYKAQIYYSFKELIQTCKDADSLALNIL